MKLLLGDRRKNAALHADHRADERIDDDEQCELREVLPQSQTDRWTTVGNHVHPHARVPTSSSPRLNARTRSISTGFGGTSASASINASRSRESMVFQRFSNPMVLVGFPLRPTPQTDPEKCPG